MTAPKLDAPRERPACECGRPALHLDAVEIAGETTRHPCCGASPILAIIGCCLVAVEMATAEPLASEAA